VTEMPGFLSRMFRRRASAEVSGAGGGKSAKNLNRSLTSVNGNAHAAPIDAWEKTRVRREDVVELLQACCNELKARGTRTLSPVNKEYLLFTSPAANSVQLHFERLHEGC